MPEKIVAAEVFISHSSKNASFTRRIVQLLTSHGILSFYSQTNIQGAKQWHDEIGAALARCTWFLLILSPDAVDSRWVKHELLYALDQDRIIPVVYRKCDHARLSWTLSSFEWIDFRKDFAGASVELLKVFGKPTR